MSRWEEDRGWITVPQWLGELFVIVLWIIVLIGLMAVTPQPAP